MDLFDRIAERYDKWYATPRGHLIDSLQKALVFNLARPLPGEQALDMGCGTGNYSIELTRRGCRVTGVDISAGMLAQAAQKAIIQGFHIDWVRADYAHLPVAAASFDLVVSVTALEFTDDPRRAALEAMRVLKPGGRFVAAALTADSAWGEYYAAEARQNPASVFASARLFTEEMMVGLLPNCRELGRSLFLLPDSPDIGADLAMEREATGRPGFIAAVWDK